MKSVVTKCEKLNIKCGLTGVTILNQVELNKVANGSSRFYVDTEGTLVEKGARETIKKDGTEKVKKTEFKINKKQVKNKILAMINVQEKNKLLLFYTITFPPAAVDDICYKILNSCLTTLRTNYNVRQYVWIAERQKIGTVHFHIAIPKKIPIVSFNQIVKNLLIFYTKAKKIVYSIKQCNKYNGVDICKDRKTRRVTNFATCKSSKKLVQYLTKYCTKSEEKHRHQAWQASKVVCALLTEMVYDLEHFETYFESYISKEFPLFTNQFFTYYAYLANPPAEVSETLGVLNRMIISQLESAAGCN